MRKHLEDETMKKVCLVLLIACSGIYTCTGRTDYHEILSHPWYFKLDDQSKGIEERWFDPDHDISSARTIEIPGSWETNLLREYDGCGWYFFDFDYKGENSKIGILFNSVDDDAQVWLNGSLIGEHQGANKAFKFDATKSIRQGKNRLTVRINDHGGPGGLNGTVELFTFEDEQDLLKGKYADLKTPVHPEWALNAVIYELNTRQFTAEGTFKAIEPRLGELKDLGVTIIWFMPIHPIGEINRKGKLGSYYSVKDFYGINPEFGNKEDFSRLVEMIHDMGMFVIIDMVANHTAWDNPLIREHPDWYMHDEKGNIISPVPDWADVADLDYTNAELRDYMIRMMEYWVRDVGIDGYRCDVAAMVPTDFWVSIRKRLDAIKPVLMLAEAETPELNAYAFDITYASSMHHLFNDIAQSKEPVHRIDEHLEYERWNYPQGSMRLRFTSNHDENSWNGSAISRMGRGGAKVGAVLTCTLPGTPLIYNGQEIGNVESLDFFDRDPIQWHENEFRKFYKVLFSLYRDNAALYKGDLKKLISSHDDIVYAFYRTSEENQVLTIVNFSDQQLNAQIKANELSGSYTSAFTGQVLLLENVSLSLELDPWEYRIYVRED